MTPRACILGVVPLILGNGAGAEMRRTLGTTVFSGMLGVTAFGIFLTPVFYYVIAGFQDMPLFSSARARPVVAGAPDGAGAGASRGTTLHQLTAVRVLGRCVAVGGVTTALPFTRREGE